VEVPFSARFHSARSGRNPDGTLVEGLRMGRPAGPGIMSGTGNVSAGNVSAGPAASGSAGTFEHHPVMVSEIVALLSPSPPGLLLDATLGGAGHARALLDAAPHLTLLGIDQDPDAVAAGLRALASYGSRARVERSRFDRIPELLDSLGVARLSAVLFDLGVSSPQLDRSERGFSYWRDGPLDMRMDPAGPKTAKDVVNGWSEVALAQLFRDNGEARFASRIARAVVAARPIESTSQLAEVVRQAIPAAARRTGGHPARRVFQAVRVAVNDELDILPAAIDAALAALVPGGRCAVLSYHSGEDRITKERFRLAVTGGCVCPPGLPCACGAVPTVRLVTRGARRPGAEEIAGNRRAESARLRVAERLPEPSSATRAGASDQGGSTP
jgi:16S rRNA (cytosine1402-N4)-methyltransferase